VRKSRCCQLQWRPLVGGREQPKHSPPCNSRAHPHAPVDKAPLLLSRCTLLLTSSCPVVPCPASSLPPSPPMTASLQLASSDNQQPLEIRIHCTLAFILITIGFDVNGNILVSELFKNQKSLSVWCVQLLSCVKHKYIVVQLFLVHIYVYLLFLQKNLVNNDIKFNFDGLPTHAAVDR
jgi:hypothetical protein